MFLYHARARAHTHTAGVDAEQAIQLRQQLGTDALVANLTPLQQTTAMMLGSNNISSCYDIMQKSERDEILCA